MAYKTAEGRILFESEKFLIKEANSHEKEELHNIFRKLVPMRWDEFDSIKEKVILVTLVAIDKETNGVIGGVERILSSDKRFAGGVGLAVLPDFQRHEIGTKLLQEMDKELKRMGVEIIIVVPNEKSWKILRENSYEWDPKTEAYLKAMGQGGFVSDSKMVKYLQTPMKSYIDELRLKQTKAIVEILKPLNLTGQALVVIKDDNVLVIPEKAAKQLEELGRMSLRVQKEQYEVYEGYYDFGEKVEMYSELRAIAVGQKVNEKVYVVTELVLPSEEKVLTFYKFRRNVDEGKLNPDNVEMIVHPYSIEYTPHYEKKLAEAPDAAVLDVHVHRIPTIPTGEVKLSPGDFKGMVRDRQFVEWIGILGVKHVKPEEFSFTKESLVVFYSGIEDFAWVEKYEKASAAAEKVKDNNVAREVILESFISEFTKSQRTMTTTWGELLKSV
jgi:N-acetylglutamate synthase-like GNAT family acetyltransferase